MNVRSLNKHHDELEALINSLESPPDVVCISETWLQEDNSVNCFKLSGYNTIINKSRKGIGGGVMMQLKDNVTIIEEFNSELAESISVLVKLNNQIFQIMLVYNPPNGNKFTFVDEFDKHLEAISNKMYRAVICGDFNINILKSNNLCSKYIDAVENNGFNQLIKQPTRVGYNSETLLDHMIVKDVNVKAAYALENQSFSDHFPINLELNTQTSKKICPKIYRDTSFLKSKIEIEKLNQTLMNKLHYNDALDPSKGIDDLFAEFQSTFSSVLDKYAPLKTTKTQERKSRSFSLSNRIKNLIAKRNRLHRTWRHNKSEDGARLRFEKLSGRNVKLRLRNIKSIITMISLVSVLVTQGRYIKF